MDYKLICFGTHEDKNPRCGVCEDEGTCMCETRWNKQLEKESKNNGDNRRYKK